MKGFSILLCALAVLTPLTVSAQAPTCVEPPAPPDAPDGATATRDEMRAAQEAVKTYNAVVTEFSACIHHTKGDVTKSNEHVRRLETVANRFNAALREFKQRSGG
jgi:hypothetical protein